MLLRSTVWNFNSKFQYRIGSLVADYDITLDQEVNVSSLERNISDALKTIQSVDVTNNGRTFSGKINTAQSITGIY